MTFWRRLSNSTQNGSASGCGHLGAEAGLLQLAGERVRAVPRRSGALRAAAAGAGDDRDQQPRRDPPHRTERQLTLAVRGSVDVARAHQPGPARGGRARRGRRRAPLAAALPRAALAPRRAGRRCRPDRRDAAGVRRHDHPGPQGRDDRPRRRDPPAGDRRRRPRARRRRGRRAARSTTTR